MKMNCSPEKALEMMKLTHEMIGYRRVAKINTGFEYTTYFGARIGKFAGIFGFEVLELEGNQELFEKCYSRMKTEICS